MLGWSLYSIKIWSFIHDTLNGRYFYLISVTSGLCMSNWFIIKYIVIQIQNLKTVQIDLLEIKALYFFVRMVTSFLFSGLRIRRRFFLFFFFQNRKKIYILQTFYFYFVLRRYGTFFFNFKARSPRTTRVCFLYINLNDEYTKQT